LRDLTGRDPEVMAYLADHPSVGRMTAALKEFLSGRVAEFVQTNRSYLTIAIGCTGGRHRSVFVAEKLGAWLRAEGQSVAIAHRDIDVGGGLSHAEAGCAALTNSASPPC
jgi:UPF0042 nucleotide-binding protein